MIWWLAQAAKERRLNAGRKLIHIAVQADMDPSTIYRFEQGHWPRNPDLIVDAYAADLEIEPGDLWRDAVQLWNSNGVKPK